MKRLPKHLEREMLETFVTRQRSLKLRGIGGKGKALPPIVSHAKQMNPPHLVERKDKGVPFVVAHHLRPVKPGERPGQVIDV